MIGQFSAGDLKKTTQKTEAQCSVCYCKTDALSLYFHTDINAQEYLSVVIESVKKTIKTMADSAEFRYFLKLV